MMVPLLLILFYCLVISLAHSNVFIPRTIPESDWSSGRGSKVHVVDNIALCGIHCQHDSCNVWTYDEASGACETRFIKCLVPAHLNQDQESVKVFTNGSVEDCVWRTMFEHKLKTNSFTPFKDRNDVLLKSLNNDDTYMFSILGKTKIQF